MTHYPGINPRPLKNAGFSLLEVMASMTIFALVMSGLAPSYVAMTRYNTRAQIKTEAIAAAQQVLDQLRVLDPTTLPTSGTVAETISLDGKDFDVTTHYCPETTYCTSVNNRHIRVEVSWEGENYFQTETVFTQLR